MAYAQLPQVENVTLTASALVDLVTAVSVQHLQTANVTPTVNVPAAPATVVNVPLPAVNVIPIVSVLVEVVIMESALIQNNTSQF